MEKLIIVLLHGGYGHKYSLPILKYLDELKIEGITRICIHDTDMKEKIIKNNKGIKIDEIPSIIVYTQDAADVYPANIENIDYIAEQLKTI